MAPKKDKNRAAAPPPRAMAPKKDKNRAAAPPPRAMARKKDKNRAAAPPPRPRNTVTLHLDGNDEEFVENFNRCQAHLQYWILTNSPFHVRYGDQLVYTTPLDGTFYYVLEYEGQHVVLVVLARMAWLIGFCTTNGYFQMKFGDLTGPYMDSSHCHMLWFKGNHASISARGTGHTIINLPVIRKCFLGLCAFDPTRPQDPKDLPIWIGTLVVLLMESKSREIHRRHCRAITEMVTPKLGTDFVTEFIVNWSNISKQVMESLTNLSHKPHDCGIRVLVTLDDLMCVFYYLHVDGCHGGLFEHDALPTIPREMRWCPVDPGVGDVNIRLPPEPIPEVAVHGQKRVSMTAAAERVPKRPKGLLGGGLGGPPMVPDCFIQYAQGQGDQMHKQECDNLVSHLLSFGIIVKDAIRAPAPTPLDRWTPPNKNDEQANREEAYC